MTETVEITPQMIEAGFDAFCEFADVDYEAASYRHLVRKILEAAMAARQSCSPHSAIDTINGRVQISGPSGESFGIIVERGDLFCGALLTLAQADELARLLLNRSLV